MSKDAVNKVSKFRNHYCFLHVIINLGDDANANGLVDIDKCYPGDVFDNLHSNASSTTYYAILLAARMFHQLGSEKYGRADLFEAFLGIASCDDDETPNTPEAAASKSRKGTQIAAKTSYFEREVGNRAHITFHNGNALWYRRDELLKFIDLHRADSLLTETTKTLQNLLKMKVPFAGARALGIIKCCSTGPFQRAFDQICENIYEMVPYTIKARDSIQELSVDASNLLENPESIFQNIPMSSIKYTHSLFADTNEPEMDSLTIMALQLVLKNMLINFERYCKLYLSEGDFVNATPEEREDLRNCPLTNRACESGMAVLDQYIKSKSNATPGFLESMIMLNSLDLEEIGKLPEDEKQKQWKVAKTCAVEYIERNTEKLGELLKTKKLILKVKQQKQSDKKKAAAIAYRSNIAAEISQYGGEGKTAKTVRDELDRDSIQELSVDASNLLENPESIFQNIPMSSIKYTHSLFADTNEPEMDSLTIMALQLVLKNMLIKFERYCKLYLSEGDFVNATPEEREDLRNCPLTNRACESGMAVLEQYIKSKSNATPGFLESMIMLNSLDLEEIGKLPEDEKQKQWKVAKTYAVEYIERNTEKLAIAYRSNIAAEISQYGGEWKTAKAVRDELAKLGSDSVQRKALETQLRYQKHILWVQEVLPAEDREQLFKERISGLEKRLIAHREKLKQVPTSSESEYILPIEKQKEVGANRKSADSSAANKKVCTPKVPNPQFLVGKRVEHCFMLQKPGRKRRSKTIFTGTILNISKESIDPLYTLYRIRYDVVNADDPDDSDDEEVETDFYYDLMVDSVNGDIKIIESE
ncbi:hypothetical protein GQR58_009763 [Nymphon striatum]|nr:hypothetical protein GQR58_009763 [Nymphon striatum]